MREFNQVYTAIWANNVFRGLPTNSQFQLLYLLTCGHGNSVGCFPLPHYVGSGDMGWKSKTYVAAMDANIKAGLVSYDPETQEVKIESWLKFNRPATAKHRIGMESTIAKVRSQAFRDALGAELEQGRKALPINGPLATDHLKRGWNARQ